jgi:hypothetical protein
VYLINRTILEIDSFQQNKAFKCPLPCTTWGA